MPDVLQRQRQGPTHRSGTRPYPTVNVWIVPAVITSIHDGDTVTVYADLGWHLSFVVHVRLAHINAPELARPGGVEARDYLATLAPVGSSVTLTSHSLDKYGRTLGSLTLPDGSDAATQMIAAAHAASYEGGPRP